MARNWCPAPQTDANASCRTGGTRATRIESYQRITRTGNTWTVTARDGTDYNYAPISTWTGQNDTLSTQYRWLLSTVVDTHNNTVTYKYSCDGAPNCYIDTIEYNATRITFFRQVRPDPIT